MRRIIPDTCPLNLKDLTCNGTLRYNVNVRQYRRRRAVGDGDRRSVASIRSPASASALEGNANATASSAQFHLPSLSAACCLQALDGGNGSSPSFANSVDELVKTIVDGRTEEGKGGDCIQGVKENKRNPDE